MGFLTWLSLMVAVALGPPFDGAESANGRIADSLFRFHSRFWPNLHHFVYEQALLTADPPRPRGSTGEVALAGVSGREDRLRVGDRSRRRSRSVSR